MTRLKKTLKDFVLRVKKEILFSELKNSQIAKSLAVGIGCIFLPFPGFQTPFLFLICLVFRANFPIAYVINWINNPFTMVPLSSAGYALGAYVINANKAVQFGVGAMILTIGTTLLSYYPLLWFVNKIKRKDK